MLAAEYPEGAIVRALDPDAPDDLSGFETTDAPLCPNRADIEAHLYALFSTTFVHPHPDAWIEIAYAKPGGVPNAAKHYSAFKLEDAADFAEKKNRAGFNIYVGAALRQGETGKSGRASSANYLAASHSWVEFDKKEDEARIGAVLKNKSLKQAITVVTGRKPHLRAHLYFRLKDNVTAEGLEAANIALKELLGSDAVQDPARVMRLAGAVSYPQPKKVKRGYIVGLVTLHPERDAPAYTVDHLIGLTGKKSSLGFDIPKPGRTDAELMALLEASRVDGKRHNSMRDAVASMVGYGWPDTAIKVTGAAYGFPETELAPLIESARKKWNRPDEAVAPGTSSEGDVERLNKKHAVLPIGDKTRVVTFGELPDFPGRETIVMTQTVPDFKALKDKYRHTYRDKKGELQSQGMGTHWIQSPKRRQYDGGMAFMPQHGGDVGNRLNLWRGFGVKPVKPDGKSGAAGCSKFLGFMRVIICNGNDEHFDYLLKREATILQKRSRSEIALGLQTKEEGCGKGFYEATMGRLLGSHAMQVTNPRHIVGNFNPHLETLLRLTADEALFVGNAEHRNALFGLITEPTLTIEPKGCGLYKADSYLNLSITSNADHFLPVSGTARRFFIPTVSAARKQDFTYFAGLKAELEEGGYEALLYHLLHEVDLTDFNVRMVPQTEALRQQRDHSLPPLDAWWVELLETGTLMGADPEEPRRAVSNSYQRLVEIKPASVESYAQHRHITQRGLYDQAREIEPRLKKGYTNDHRLGHFLKERGCESSWVRRRRGWAFPLLSECRAAWDERYPEWPWRDPSLAKWWAEEPDGV